MPKRKSYPKRSASKKKSYKRRRTSYGSKYKSSKRAYRRTSRSSGSTIPKGIDNYNVYNLPYKHYARSFTSVDSRPVVERIEQSQPIEPKLKEPENPFSSLTGINGELNKLIEAIPEYAENYLPKIWNMALTAGATPLIGPFAAPVLGAASGFGLEQAIRGMRGLPPKSPMSAVTDIALAAATGYFSRPGGLRQTNICGFRNQLNMNPRLARQYSAKKKRQSFIANISEALLEDLKNQDLMDLAIDTAGQLVTDVTTDPDTGEIEIYDPSPSYHHTVRSLRTLYAGQTPYNPNDRYKAVYTDTTSRVLKKFKKDIIKDWTPSWLTSPYNPPTQAEENAMWHEYGLRNMRKAEAEKKHWNNQQWFNSLHSPRTYDDLMSDDPVARQLFLETCDDYIPDDDSDGKEEDFNVKEFR